MLHGEPETPAAARKWADWVTKFAMADTSTEAYTTPAVLEVPKASHWGIN